MKTFQLCFLPPPFPHRNACGVTSTPPRRCCGVMGVTRAGGAKSGAAPSPLLSLTSTLLASAFQPRKPGVLWEEVRLPQSRSFPKSVSSIFFPFRKEKPFVVKRWVFWSSSPPRVRVSARSNFTGSALRGAEDVALGSVRGFCSFAFLLLFFFFCCCCCLPFLLMLMLPFVCNLYFCADGIVRHRVQPVRFV